jgi:hypothetical protein
MKAWRAGTGHRASAQNVGFTMAAALALLGFARLLKAAVHAPWRSRRSASTPRLLAPFNRVWLKFGMVLYHIVNPAVMAILFFAQPCLGA